MSPLRTLSTSVLDPREPVSDRDENGDGETDTYGGSRRERTTGDPFPTVYGDRVPTPSFPFTVCLSIGCRLEVLQVCVCRTRPRMVTQTRPLRKNGRQDLSLLTSHTPPENDGRDVGPCESVVKTVQE